MFTGIVSCFASVLGVEKRNSVIEIVLPSRLSGVSPGDSVAVDGVCLTVEKIDSAKMVFALAQDTLSTTSWSLLNLENKAVNLEPSLKVGSSLGGHFVTGHVDGMAEVKEIEFTPSESLPPASSPQPRKAGIKSAGNCQFNPSTSERI